MKNVFDETVKLVEAGGYTCIDEISRESKFVSLELDPNLTKNTKLYAKEIHPVADRKYVTQFSVLNEDCLSVARRVVSEGNEVCLLILSECNFLSGEKRP
jgi:hypothetical protein